MYFLTQFNHSSCRSNTQTKSVIEEYKLVHKVVALWSTLRVCQAIWGSLGDLIDVSQT